MNRQSDTAMKIDGIGLAVREFRTMHGYSDGAAFATLLAIDANTLSKYETGKQPFPFELLESIAKLLGKSPVAILVWCMRSRFPEIGGSSFEISDFVVEALAELENRQNPDRSST
jgi:transcriptional regulator with XRE-family HTH domain